MPRPGASAGRTPTRDSGSTIVRTTARLAVVSMITPTRPWALVTGSLRGLFPEGIPVAKVTAVLPRPPGALRKVVRAEPLVKFGLLEEVVVLGKL